MSVVFAREYLSTLDNNIEWTINNNIKWTIELPTTELPNIKGCYWVKNDIRKIGICRDELELLKGLKWYGPLTLPKE